ncbi:MAG TPA: Hsp20 family protein [Hyphomicrobiaceae bacterium]|jgi:molecular chaperone IbpA|nr:Hsp20 family protein [Hyphomicrobiaceae bacterium]
MATLDFTPLYRSSIGFDQLPGLLAHALQRDETGFPPYNIEKVAEDQYRITLAVAGFTTNDVEIICEQNLLTVRGKAKETGPKSYLYRGISARSFERQFDLAEYVEVTGAVLNNGLLEISLQRELPEALKPRRIPIGTGAPAELTDDGPNKRASLRAA